MSGWDQGRVFYSDAINQPINIDSTRTTAKERFRDFIRNFRLNNIYIYR